MQDDMNKRIVKFKTCASVIRNQEQLKLILDSFPEERRLAIYNEVKFACPATWTGMKSVFPYC